MTTWMADWSLAMCIQRLCSRSARQTMLVTLYTLRLLRIPWQLLTQNNQIADSFRKFGIADSTKNLLVVKVSISPEMTHDSVAAHLESSIQGTAVPFNDKTFSGISDVNKIKKAYKLGALTFSGDKTDSSQVNSLHDDAKRRLEVSLLGAIALRGSWNPLRVIQNLSFERLAKGPSAPRS